MDTVPKDTAPKKSGPRVLQYRGQVRWAGNFLKWSSILSFGLAFVVGAVFYLDTPSSQSLVISIPFLIIGTIFFAEYWWLFRPLILARICVLADRIDIQRGDHHEQILFADIALIKSRILAYVGGWFTLVLKNGKSIRFTIVLERSEYLIEGLYQSRPDLMPLEKYQKLRDSLVLADHGLARIYTLFHGKNLIGQGLYHFLMPFLCALGAYFIQAQELVIQSDWSYITWFMYLGFYIAWGIEAIGMFLISSRVNKIVKQRLQINSRDKRRDIAAETLWMRRLFPIKFALTLGVFFIIAQYDLNQVGTFSSYLPSPNFNISADESFWVDERYNCVKCKYSLQKGDLLSIKGHILPRGVVALPGESTLVNFNEGKQHVVVAQERVVPPSKIAVQIWEMGRPITGFLSISQVKGLITHSFPSEIRPSSVTIGPSLTWLPPQRSLTMVEGCELSTLTNVKSNLQQLSNPTDALLKARKYPEILVSLNSAAETILKEAKSCPGIVSALSTGLQAEEKFKNKPDQAWIILSVMNEIEMAIDLKLKATDPVFEHTKTMLSALMPQSPSDRAIASSNTLASTPAQISGSLNQTSSSMSAQGNCFGYPSNDGKIRLFSQTECTNILGGKWNPNGECLKKEGGSYSFDLRNRNSVCPK